MPTLFSHPLPLHGLDPFSRPEFYLPLLRCVGYVTEKYPRGSSPNDPRFVLQLLATPLPLPNNEIPAGVIPAIPFEKWITGPYDDVHDKNVGVDMGGELGWLCLLRFLKKWGENIFAEDDEKTWKGFLEKIPVSLGSGEGMILGRLVGMVPEGEEVSAGTTNTSTKFIAAFPDFRWGSFEPGELFLQENIELERKTENIIGQENIEQDAEKFSGLTLKQLAEALGVSAMKAKKIRGCWMKAAADKEQKMSKAEQFWEMSDSELLGRLSRRESRTNTRRRGYGGADMGEHAGFFFRRVFSGGQSSIPPRPEGARGGMGPLECMETLFVGDAAVFRDVGPDKIYCEEEFKKLCFSERGCCSIIDLPAVRFCVLSRLPSKYRVYSRFLRGPKCRIARPGALTNTEMAIAGQGYESIQEWLDDFLGPGVMEDHYDYRRLLHVSINKTVENPATVEEMDRLGAVVGHQAHDDLNTRTTTAFLRQEVVDIPRRAAHEQEGPPELLMTDDGTISVYPAGSKLVAEKLTQEPEDLYYEWLPRSSESHYEWGQRAGSWHPAAEDLYLESWFWGAIADGEISSEDLEAALEGVGEVATPGESATGSGVQPPTPTWLGCEKIRTEQRRRAAAIWREWQDSQEIRGTTTTSKAPPSPSSDSTPSPRAATWCVSPLLRKRTKWRHVVKGWNELLRSGVAERVGGVDGRPGSDDGRGAAVAVNVRGRRVVVHGPGGAATLRRRGELSGAEARAAFERVLEAVGEGSGQRSGKSMTDIALEKLGALALQ